MTLSLRPAGVAGVAAGLLLAGCGGTTPTGTPSPAPSASLVVATPTPASTPTPTPTSSGPAYDRHGLPRLYPVARPGHAQAGGPRITGRAGPDGVEAGQEHLVVTVDGASLSAPIPAGWGASVSTTPVRVGTAPDDVAYLVSQEGGDSDTWTVYVVHDGALVAATRPEHSAFGGGFTADGQKVVLSWQTPGGRGLYTRVGLGGPYRNEVYSWRLRGTRLVPTDLGVVCLSPRDPHLWGRC